MAATTWQFNIGTEIKVWETMWTNQLKANLTGMYLVWSFVKFLFLYWSFTVFVLIENPKFPHWVWLRVGPLGICIKKIHINRWVIQVLMIDYLVYIFFFLEIKLWLISYPFVMKVQIEIYSLIHLFLCCCCQVLILFSDTRYCMGSYR